jgi:uncharacterized protein (DUF58 family)
MSFPGETVLTRRGLYMLPTRHGLTFAVVILVLLVAGINYGNSLVYGLTFLLIGVAVVSMLITDRNLLHLRVRTGAGAAVFAGEAATFRVHFINEGVRARYAVVLICDKQEAASVDVAPGATATAELRVLTTHRGWISAPAFHLKTRFPLGILYSWSRRIVPEERCLVYPRPSDPWQWHTAADHSDTGSARPTQGGDDFSGVREYRPGDSPRQIDWKSAARGRGLFTKEFAAGLSETLWFDLANTPGTDVEVRLSKLCRAVIDAERAGLHYGLRLGGAAIDADGGELHQQRCLHALALHGLGDT